MTEAGKCLNNKMEAETGDVKHRVGRCTQELTIWDKTMLSINLIKHKQQQRVKQTLTSRAQSSTEEQTGQAWCE